MCWRQIKSLCTHNRRTHSSKVCYIYIFIEVVTTSDLNPTGQSPSLFSTYFCRLLSVSIAAASRFDRYLSKPTRSVRGGADDDPQPLRGWRSDCWGDGSLKVFWVRSDRKRLRNKRNIACYEFSIPRVNDGVSPFACMVEFCTEGR